MTSLSLFRMTAIAGIKANVFQVLLLLAFCLGQCMPNANAQAVRGDTTNTMRPVDPDEPFDFNDARMVEQSVPTRMTTNGLYNVSVQMKNIGTLSWESAWWYRLGAASPYDNTMWGLGRVELPGPVIPGGTVQFNFQVRAPATPGTYIFQWRMVQDSVEWFGAMTLPVTVTVVAPVNNAQVVSQSVPAQMETGRYYPLSVTMKNTGDTTWTRALQYTLMAQAPHNNTTWGFNRVPLPVEEVRPGESTTFRFHVMAPATAGSYTSQWGMQREGHGSFGGSTAPIAVNVTAPPPAVNNARVVFVDVPTQMRTGASYVIGVTMENTGNTTWSSGAGFYLGSQNPQDNGIWGVSRLVVRGGVSPGQRHRFDFQVTAPQPGSYGMQWQMLKEGSQWFGEKTNNVVLVNEAVAANVTYIHTDGLGSPVARTDAGGNVISRTRYEPYGYIASGAAPTIGFTGHVNDAETGLTYMQQRYYDPVAGRFLSIDPVTTDANTGGSFNRYGYANNNPYKYIDPDGRAVESVTMDKNKNVHIVVGMSYKGAVTAKQAAAFNSAIIRAYSGFKGEYAVNVTIIPSEQAKLGNYVNVVDGTKGSETSGIGARETTLYTNDPAGATKEQVMVHEFGHLAGARDQYYSDGTAKPGYENNVMGNAKSGAVDERTIKEILERNPPKEPRSE